MLRRFISLQKSRFVPYRQFSILKRNEDEQVETSSQSQTNENYYKQKIEQMEQKDSDNESKDRTFPFLTLAIVGGASYIYFACW